MKVRTVPSKLFGFAVRDGKSSEHLLSSIYPYLTTAAIFHKARSVFISNWIYHITYSELSTFFRE